MALKWRSRLLSLLTCLGMESHVLTSGAALVTRRGRRLNVHELDERTWVVEDSDPCSELTIESLDRRTWALERGLDRRRTVHRIGSPAARSHLLVDEAAARTELPHQQMQLFRYMAAQHLGWILHTLRATCVLDVGANIGEFGAMLREAGYDGRIVSFEPLPHLRQQLEARAAGDPGWQVLPFALGDETTEAEMTVVGRQGQTSSLLPVSDFGRRWSPRLQGIRRETVQIRRLDEVFDEAVAGLDDPRVFLKMDTQGYDLRAFAGAGERVKDLLGLQSEISSVPIYDGMPHMTEAIATYEGAGFGATGIFPVTRDTKSHRIIEFDIVMIRPEAVCADDTPPVR